MLIFYPWACQWPRQEKCHSWAFAWKPHLSIAPLLKPKQELATSLVLLAPQGLANKHWGTLDNISFSNVISSIHHGPGGDHSLGLLHCGGLGRGCDWGHHQGELGDEDGIAPDGPGIGGANAQGQWNQQGEVFRCRWVHTISRIPELGRRFFSPVIKFFS